MTQAITISLEAAFYQAKMTAEEYLIAAIKILETNELKFTTQDAIALAHSIALDFNTANIGIKLQEIGDALSE